MTGKRRSHENSRYAPSLRIKHELYRKPHTYTICIYVYIWENHVLCVGPGIFFCRSPSLPQPALNGLKIDLFDVWSAHTYYCRPCLRRADAFTTWEINVITRCVSYNRNQTANPSPGDAADGNSIISIIIIINTIIQLLSVVAVSDRIVACGRRSYVSEKTATTRSPCPGHVSQAFFSFSFVRTEHPRKTSNPRAKVARRSVQTRGTCSSLRIIEHCNV
jgi:hypothetical protein